MTYMCSAKEVCIKYHPLYAHCLRLLSVLAFFGSSYSQ